MLLLACCCLLLLAAAAAKPGRSTLDPKKGYKTKTGSTSSVTLVLPLALPLPLPLTLALTLALALTLIKTEYWDRAATVAFRCGEVLPHGLPIPQYPTSSIPLFQSGHAREKSGIQCTTEPSGYKQKL